MRGCVMYVAVMVGTFVKQDVREWYPSTTGPLFPTITDSLLAPGWVRPQDA